MLDLVLTGRAGGAVQQIEQFAADLGISDRVILTGFVPDEDLPVLYSGAELFAFVSLYEGFGLPPLEAMACGTPVIASDAASLPEVVGAAGILVDPEDTDAIAAALAEVMADDAVRTQLRQAGLQQAQQFDWSVPAGRLMQTCKELACVS